MSIKILLEKVEKIVKHNEELSALKGENFNVFQIFDMESDENKMHSRFINTLINPKGKHGRGTIFLKLFLQTLNIPSYFENLENVSTKVEHSIGSVKIDGMNSTGGRIDIYLWDKKKSITIENKIYANDQEKQIVRYWNYRKDSNIIYYLNLFGTEPVGDYSRGNLKSEINGEGEIPDFYCISYSTHIIEWLEKCQKEAADFPIIRETIKQYIITLKRLTGQLTNQKMSIEINKLILENYEAAKIIANNIENAKISIIDKFLNDLKYSLRNELGANWKVEKKDIKDKWSKLKIYHIEWIDKAAVTLEAQSFFWKNESILGLPAPKESMVRQKIGSSISESEIRTIKSDYPKSSEGWAIYRPIFNFYNDSHFSKLLNEESKDKFISNISSEIIQLAKRLEEHLKNA